MKKQHKTLKSVTLPVETVEKVDEFLEKSEIKGFSSLVDKALIHYMRSMSEK